jgi:hypothetical protein
MPFILTCYVNNEVAFAMVTSVFFFSYIASKVLSNLLLLAHRRAGDADPNDGAVGPRRCVDDVRAERIRAVCAAVPAGLMRGGDLFPACCI